MHTNLNSKQTLASIPGITVVESPYRARPLRIGADVKPKDHVIYDRVFRRFLQLPLLLDEFGALHDVRRAFWRHWEDRLSSEEALLVRQNPLRWGMVSAIVAMIPEYQIPVRAIDLCTYTHMNRAEKVAYVEELRRALVALFE